jgi:hypothetical protein
VHHHAGRHAEEAVDVAHPLGVAAGQVVVDRDQVSAAPLERVEIDRQGGGEGLALAGPHLGDLSLVQHHAAHQLDVEVPHLQGAPRGLAHGGEGLGQDVVQRGALIEALAELRCAGPELSVALGLHRRS